METNKPVERRTFLKGILAASAVGVAPFNILKAGPSPNSKLNIAAIGVGGRGAGVAGGMAGTDNIVALCDVDEVFFIYQGTQSIPIWNMGLVVTLVAVIQLITEWHMTIGSDVQSKNDLFAVRTEIFIMPMLELDSIGVGIFVLPFKSYRCTVIMDLVCNQLV